MNWSEEYLAELGECVPLLALFDALPGVCFFVKDSEGRYVAANAEFAALLGVGSAREVLGMADGDFFDREMAALLRSEDEHVATSAEPMRDEIWWMFHLATGEAAWHAVTKLPLWDRRGGIAGVAGVIRPLGETDELSGELRALGEVGRYIEKHYPERITLDQLAQLAGLSNRHFQRLFTRAFRAGPADHLLRVRIRAASRRLAETKGPLGDIARASGFYDQAHFSNQFRRLRGMTPLAYRKQQQAQPAVG